MLLDFVRGDLRIDAEAYPDLVVIHALEVIGPQRRVLANLFRTGTEGSLLGTKRHISLNETDAEYLCQWVINPEMLTAMPSHLETNDAWLLHLRCAVWRPSHVQGEDASLEEREARLLFTRNWESGGWSVETSFPVRHMLPGFGRASRIVEDHVRFQGAARSGIDRRPVETVAYPIAMEPATTRFDRPDPVEGEG